MAGDVSSRIGKRKKQMARRSLVHLRTDPEFDRTHFPTPPLAR